MLALWNPLHEVRDLERTFERAFAHPLTTVFDEVAIAWPRVDVSESEEAYLYEVDAPGLEKKDLRADLKDNVLTISGEYGEEKEDRKRAWLSRERVRGKFVRSFEVPGDIEEKNLSAEYKNGTLRVTLPKGERAKPREIPIHVS